MASLTTAFITLLTVAFLGFFGIKGARASLILWPTVYQTETSSTEARIDALSEAIAVWPLLSFYQERAFLYRDQSKTALSDKEATTLLDLALQDFRKANELHPFHPVPMLGLATLLSDLARESESEEMFRRGIQAQGGMEAGFRGKYLFAVRLHRKGIAAYKEGKMQAAKKSFSLAAHYMDESSEKDGGGGTLEHYRLRVHAHENYGLTLNRLSDYQGALREFNLASTLPYGTSAHYLAAILLGERAIVVWEEREGSDALRLFLDARQRVDQAQELPENVTPEKVNEWRQYFDQSIALLKAAGFTPSDKVDL